MATAISIVVNTYNRGALLRDTLTALSELHHRCFEVIVVNGPSTDCTAAVIEDFAGRVKAVSCPEANLAVSRNRGIREAAGEVVAFIDDDAVPHPDWLLALEREYTHPDVGAVGGFTIDNSGVAYQCRKTLCDRFGNAYYPSEFLDERQLCTPQAPLYPSLLGTNSSFRLAALRQIGGFDHSYAYLLDETDVCLRLVDAGYRVIYAPDALVFHQYAPSHIRATNRIPRTLYPSAVSKAYFIMRHGAAAAGSARAVQALEQYREDILRANMWLLDQGEITSEHRVSLDADLSAGLRDGQERALAARQDLDSLDDSAGPSPFLPYAGKPGLRIGLVSRNFPPRGEAGIARWTWMMARGLADAGHVVHVITESKEPFTRYADGYWVHGIAEVPGAEAAELAARQAVPQSLACWMRAVEIQVARLKAYGLDVVSFPIWDLEGAALVGDSSLGVVMSLHTSYALARPFKPEWSLRPLLAGLHIDRVIAAERRLLQHAPHILANSQAIIEDLRQAYGVEIADRVVLAPHGTTDPLAGPGAEDRGTGTGGGLKVAFAGRFEQRKGFDLACTAFAALLEAVPAAEVTLVGDEVTAATRRWAQTVGLERLLSHPRVHFRGLVPRTELDRLYRDSDVVVMPSRYESFGLVAIEAMAARTPVIALACGGLREVVQDGITGFLIADGAEAANAIAARLRLLAEDHRLLQRMQQAARKAFEERYTIGCMIAAAEPVYYAAAGRQ